jgi:hypothetical protein
MFRLGGIHDNVAVPMPAGLVSAASLEEGAFAQPARFAAKSADRIAQCPHLGRRLGFMIRGL